nr:hypothetical protein [Streptomyces chartreusis]
MAHHLYTRALHLLDGHVEAHHPLLVAIRKKINTLKEDSVD